MRICSLLPSATEIAFALGLGDQVVAVSHECDYPPAASSRSVLTKSAIHQKIHRSLDVDREVERHGGDIYEIDEKLLEQLKPDLILTQELCHVCAVSYTKVKEAARVLDADTKIVSLEPTNLEEIVEYQPEIIVLSPCGFDANQVMQEAHVLGSYQGWEKIPAFQSSRIYAVNASAYFSRSGPRVVDGLEILAHIIHPELFPENPHPEAVKMVPRELVLGKRVIDTT